MTLEGRLTVSHEEWCEKYTRMRDIADRISAYRNQRAKQVCKAAGLDPGCIGVHPHNAMVGLHYGRPWPDVDYSLVRKCLWIMEHQFDGHRILEKWDRRVRNIPERA